MKDLKILFRDVCRNAGICIDFPVYEKTPPISGNCNRKFPGGSEAVVPVWIILFSDRVEIGCIAAFFPGTVFRCFKPDFHRGFHNASAVVQVVALNLNPVDSCPEEFSWNPIAALDIPVVSRGVVPSGMADLNAIEIDLSSSSAAPMSRTGLT